MKEILKPVAGEDKEPSPRIANALRTGAAGGAQAAEDLWALVRQGASTTVYKGSYYLAYGVTFGAMIASHVIPRESAFSRGLREGTENAVRAFRTWEEPVSAPDESVTEAAVLASEKPTRRTKRRSTEKGPAAGAVVDEPIPAT